MYDKNELRQPTEEVATLTFMGVSERVVIAKGRNGKWRMSYYRTNGGEQACINDAESREEILRLTKRFMQGHGRALVENVIQSAEHLSVADRRID
jgi:hypothetical protein